MKIKVTEHKVPKRTRWGTVEKSLNQHYVHMQNPDSGEWIHCGYVGQTAFLPLAGFPVELVEGVQAKCSELLDRKLTSAAPPPTMAQVQAALDSASPASDDDDEGND